MKNVQADIGEYIWDSLQQSLGGPGDVVGVSENISVRAWVWTNCAVMDEIEHGINLSHQHYMEWSE